MTLVKELNRTQMLASLNRRGELAIYFSLELNQKGDFCFFFLGFYNNVKFLLTHLVLFVCLFEVWVFLVSSVKTNVMEKILVLFNFCLMIVHH